jgi:type II secretory pathway component GspD/PulD (secretin)
MAAFRRRLSALAVIAMASAVLAQGQEGPGRGRSGRQAQRPERTREKPAAVAQVEARPVSRPEEFMPNAPIAVIPVTHTSVWELMSVLSTMRPALGHHVLLAVEGNTNSLIVAGEDEKVLEKVRELVAQLDGPQAAHGAPKANACKAVVLRHSYARDVENHLQRLAQPRGRSAARIVGDQRANTVWIAGTEAEVVELAELARQMDDNAANAGLPGDEGEPELQFYALAHAEAEALAETVGQIGRAMNLKAGVVADEASGTLIAFATPGAHTHLKTIIAKLDVPAKHGPE